MRFQQGFSCLAAFALTSCASSVPTDEAAWHAYQKFETELTNEAVVDLSAYLSAATLSSIEATKDESEREALKVHASYPLWLASETNHFEKETPRGICLTVNGVTHDGKPGSVSVAYVGEYGRLKADQLHYVYPAPGESLPDAALCPSEIGLDYPDW